MTTFIYTAVAAESGDETRGTVVAANPNEASARLKEQGLIPIRLRVQSGESRGKRWNKLFRQVDSLKSVLLPGVTEGTIHALDPLPGESSRSGEIVSQRVPGAAWFRRSRVTPAQSAEVLGRLATLVRAGLPLLRSVEIVRRQEHRRPVVSLLAQLEQELNAGVTLSVFMSRHPACFSAVATNLVRAGETSGQLAELLAKIAAFSARAERLKRRLATALAYPAIVGAVSVCIVAALMIFVVPRFESIFATQLRGHSLPTLTQWVVGISRAVARYWFLGPFLVMATALILPLIRRQRTGRRWFDGWIVRFPLLGPLVLRAALARSTRTLGTLLGGGVAVAAAIPTAQAVAGLTMVEEAFARAADGVQEGRPISQSWSTEKRFPPAVAAMVEVGEETGQLPEMLLHVATICEEDVESGLAAATAVMEPLLIVSMALIVGTIVVALFLPMVEIIRALSSG